MVGDASNQDIGDYPNCSKGTHKLDPTYNSSPRYLLLNQALSFGTWTLVIKANVEQRRHLLECSEQIILVPLKCETVPFSKYCNPTDLRVLHFIYLFVCLFMAVLGLRCCAWAFSSCGDQGLLFVAVCGLLIQWLLFLQSTGSRHVGFSSCGMWAQ